MDVNEIKNTNDQADHGQPTATAVLEPPVAVDDINEEGEPEAATDDAMDEAVGDEIVHDSGIVPEATAEDDAKVEASDDDGSPDDGSDSSDGGDEGHDDEPEAANDEPTVVVEDSGDATDEADIRDTDDTPEAPSGIDSHKVQVIKKALKSIEQNISNIVKLLEESTPAGEPHAEPVQLTTIPMAVNNGNGPVEGRVVEGVFNGIEMVGSDGKAYAVPPNYASKSKLVEGDLLKLTITPKGSFIYKQIGPIDRSRVIATLGFDSTNGEFYATTENRRWSVLKASVTYFRGDPGDEVVVLVPKSAPSKWAAVENIIKRNPLG